MNVCAYNYSHKYESILGIIYIYVYICVYVCVCVCVFVLWSKLASHSSPFLVSFKPESVLHSPAINQVLEQFNLGSKVITYGNDP